VADRLTPDERAAARLIFEGKAEGRQRPCLHCGGIHLRACRRVKRVAWHPDGSIIEAEYWPDGDWDEADITWPEEAYENDLDEEDAGDG
jgi:hypothetical protein